MHQFEIINEVETKVVQLERARAVLLEVEDYFDTEESIKNLPYNANQILLLLHVADGLIYNTIPELSIAVAQLLTYSNTTNETP